MSTKKIFMFFIVFLIVIASTSIASAADDTVTVGGIDFKLPDGFTENSTYSDTAFEQNHEIERDFNTYVNGNDEIQFYVKTSVDGTEYTDLEPGNEDVEKTIGNVTGYYNSDIDGLKCFTYIEDGKMVSILTTDDDYFSEVMM